MYAFVFRECLVNSYAGTRFFVLISRFLRSARKTERTVTVQATTPAEASVAATAARRGVATAGR